MRYPIFLISFLISAQAFACFAKAPLLVQNSFQNYLTLEHIQFSPALNNFCKELESKENFNKLTADKIYEDRSIERFLSLIEKQDAVLKKEYRKQISKVKEIENLNQRLEATYELVAKHYGFFELSTTKFFRDKDLQEIKTPDQMRNALLAVSYLLTQRKNGEYSVGVVTTYKEDPELSRQWVRLSLVGADGKEQKLDLDMSVTGSIFLPLILRHRGMSEKEVSDLKSECAELKICLMTKKE